MSGSDGPAALYVDTSAAARIILKEPGAAATEASLSRSGPMVASALMRTELQRVGLRMGATDEVERFLEGVSLIPLTADLLRAAESVEPTSVATLDAIHLVTALAAQESGVLDSLMTYDRNLAKAAAHHGLTVLAPD